ncbi:hypothetical protein ACFFX1_10840 [Dactylosporangium sucinum]|uniref:Uncharacterized protein n=1 Tax=Dactylosporangium sucinum TaxID=1424081 RepID=A0A917TJC1_9ACTN|nr:hypothetical protein [Dactylosporangium sucinum]GGM22923.1 hypothetical protein GCM10007977_025120 [Dactylosporangium sucinum]
MVWRDLRPGMAIEWWDEPYRLDVTGVGDADDEGMCAIDALQGAFRWPAYSAFTEITPELDDWMAATVMEEQDRWLP